MFAASIRRCYTFTACSDPGIVLRPIGSRSDLSSAAELEQPDLAQVELGANNSNTSGDSKQALVPKQTRPQVDHGVDAGLKSYQESGVGANERMRGVQPRAFRQGGKALECGKR